MTVFHGDRLKVFQIEKKQGNEAFISNPTLPAKVVI